MNYTHLLFDVDDTLLDLSDQPNQESFDLV